MPTQTPTSSPLPSSPATSPPPGERLQVPPVSQDPKTVDIDLADPTRVRSLTDDQIRQNETNASRLAQMFVPEDVPFDEAIAAGLPAGTRPYVLTMEKAFQMALVNSRPYQYQLENVYLNALPVTLQRFSFGPQFIAGLSPTTSVAGAGASVGGGFLPTQNPTTSFLYNTRATGNQVSTLNYGTVAGVGKLFDNGGGC